MMWFSFSTISRKASGSKRKSLLVFWFILLAALTAAILGAYNRSHRHKPPPLEKITLGIAANDNAALVHIASGLDLFSKNGLDVSLKEYESGSLAVRDLAEGKLDFATAADFSFAVEGFVRDDLRALTTISVSSDNALLIARRDRGIESPHDLEGKTIGVVQGTSSEFFLATFLAFHGILNSEVRIVDIRPSETTLDIMKGAIDAAMLWEPYAFLLRTALGKNATVWDGQGGQDYYFLLISTGSYIASHRGTVEKLLRALAEAEQSAEFDPARAKRIIQRRFHYSDQYMAWMWPKSRLEVGLTQDLLILMEDEARWHRKKEAMDYDRIPNYYSFIYLEGLERVKPNAVTIIH
ncbi:MAG: NrtA/SsuA/CpmA family ABC transporter substrate-binding protein [Syntrophorhabdales bacterium]|jgi:NitT/TauT family transport system substrate-binding protein